MASYEAVPDPRERVVLDPELLRPVLRLAGSMFARLGPTFNLSRPTYDDVLAGRVAKLPEDAL